MNADTSNLNMTNRIDLLKIHGHARCHICGEPKAGPGKDICSYPHGMMPERAADPEHPTEGFWTWKKPDEQR